ncbi:MAG: ddl [Bacteroidetes bacterium]|jgi:D-alanine-D-alanine ligase|nr:ddl [Bacteroidota bacterium]
MKKNVAIVWGGYSSEAIVSAKSMEGISSFLDKEKYNVYPVEIRRDRWIASLADGAVGEIDKNDFSIVAPDGRIKIDFAYITIHGTPGEDGHLQGYFDMIGMPYSSCGMMASALTFDKYICNKFLKNFDLKVADSALIRKGDEYSTEKIVGDLGLPVFVKPAAGGSSFATTKVKEAEKLREAIELAFGESGEVIVETFISGREVTCGCCQLKGEVVVLPITEVVTQNEFFDYQAKYEGQVQEITPARLSEEMTREIQQKTSYIYRLIGAKGIIRVDYIISGEIPFVLEVNTTPGMTATSFIPQQVHAAGLEMKDVLSHIVDNHGR